jgi:hypothetical protein
MTDNTKIIQDLQDMLSRFKEYCGTQDFCYNCILEIDNQECLKTVTANVIYIKRNKEKR